jgi:antirestriction protein ArdC
MASSVASFSDLLCSAVTDPGIISAAYRQFHNYSLGNQLLAWSQCLARSLQPGPIATFPRWQALGRHVLNGEKALTLCMPVTVKRSGDADPDTPETFTRFVFKPRWFVLAQTEGAVLPSQPTETWETGRALTQLKIEEVPFDALDGNCLGFARARSIAVNPVNPMPHKTRFHELAHVLLGHTVEGTQSDSEITPRSLRECEAEAVSLLCCAALELPGIDQCRGYIQMWWGAGNPIPEDSARRILKTADQILQAGRPNAEAS